ncbi:hypothetical protein LI90_668 [Carbonactinospora thermoautotrophica]|uniref:Uncharacterized protein n=2 Tax=Carbonactinospora thermoautotrophica TaxID=1469144 RepID=A0A132MMF3_9ACTN|nr:hypothetical protein LI90_668 [Carbonactinospora thermoautotrophica]
MPLPGLPLDIPVKGQQYAADFTELSTVSSAELLRAKRIACLSETGITLLLQRHTHHLSRAVIDLPTFYQSISGVLTEAELEQDWVEGLVPGIWDNPDPDQLANASKAFHEFLGPPGSDLREKLKQVRTQAEVRRTVREEIRARRQQA